VALIDDKLFTSLKPLRRNAFMKKNNVTDSVRLIGGKGDEILTSFLIWFQLVIHKRLVIKGAFRHLLKAKIISRKPAENGALWIIDVSINNPQYPGKTLLRFCFLLSNVMKSFFKRKLKQ